MTILKIFLFNLDQKVLDSFVQNKNETKIWYMIR